MKTLRATLLILLTVIIISCNNNKPQKTPPKKPVTEKPVEKPKEVVVQKPSLIFTVQIGAYKKDNPILAAVNGVSQYKENGLIKYRLGNYTSYEAANTYKKSILNKYADAFIQALQNGKPIAITKAIAMQK